MKKVPNWQRKHLATMRLEGNSNSFEPKMKIKKHLELTKCFAQSGLGVSAAKTTECCFCKRCETKQGVSRGADLRSRRLTTMRLEGNSNLFEPKMKIKKHLELTKCFVWSGLRGSNPPPPPWQGGALPNELNPHIWCLRSESNQRHGDFQSPALPTELQRRTGWRLGWGSNPRPLA